MSSVENVSTSAEGAGNVGLGSHQQEAPLSQILHLQEQLAKMMAQLSTPAPVNVNVSMASHRIGIFTGLKPSGGAEVEFSTWKDQVNTYTNETTDNSQEVLRRVKSSLKGVAKSQISDCTTVESILEELSKTYSKTKCADDINLEFITIKPKREESPSEYLLKLWDFLTREGQFSSEEIKRKVYHSFMTNIRSSFPLLELEVRTKFGIPGEAKPDLSDVLRTVRLATVSAPSQQTARSQSQVTGGEIDYDRLAEAVVKKLSTQLPNLSTEHSSTAEAPRAQAPPPDFQGAPRPRRGNCYQCGRPGHIARFCRNSNINFKNNKKNLNENQLLVGSTQQLHRQ